MTERICSCIRDIEEEVRRGFDADSAFLEHSGTQSSQVSYRRLTRAGVPAKHLRYTSVKWRYCPFCGILLD